jgi:hypothetical protein
MPDMVFLLSSGCSGIGVVDERALDEAFAQARCGVSEFFPARVGKLNPGAAILCREADLDQLLLLGRQLDDPGKGETSAGWNGRGDRRGAAGMTIARFAVPPIVKTVTVRAAPERAFALFAGDLSSTRVFFDVRLQPRQSVVPLL